MFAPKIAKAATKAAANPTNTTVPRRSTPTPQRLRGHSLRNSDPASVAAHGAMLASSWDLGKVPLFPPHRANLPVGPVDHRLECEADMIAGRMLGSGDAHLLLREGLSRARLHIGREAEMAATALDSAAFTVGDNIVFGAGQYRPGTRSGDRLIAHEAVHVAQQARSGRLMVQRQAANAVQMPPLEITSTLNPTERSVSHLDRLTNVGVTPQTPTIAHAPADIEHNAPDPAARLPFTDNGWDGAEILRQLGQYDRMPGTDSDALRCVQAVGMAARVPDGPTAVTAYLHSLVAQGLLTDRMTDRKRTAIQVLNHVIGRIETRRATYGDMAWAQEAMHDLFYDDVSGTPLSDIPAQVAPGLDLTKNLQRLDVWCDTPQQVMEQAARLQPGEQLLIEEWTVSLNTAFDQLSEQNIEVAEGHSVLVNVNGRQVRIRRIPMDQRPPHSALDFSRDSRSGHQLLIMKDAAATGTLRLYEPEITPSGKHFEGLAADGSNLAVYFGDQPRFGIYHYIEIIGKLQPGLTAPSASRP